MENNVNPSELIQHENHADDSNLSAQNENQNPAVEITANTTQEQPEAAVLNEHATEVAIEANSEQTQPVAEVANETDANPQQPAANTSVEAVQEDLSKPATKEVSSETNNETATKQEQKENSLADETIEEPEEEIIFMSDEELKSLNKEELIEQLKKYVAYDDTRKVKTIIGSIRSAFNVLVKEEQKAALEKYISEGGKKEDYQQPEDPAVTEFNKVFAIYKEKKQKQQEQLEKELQENLVQKKAILEEMKKIIEKDEILKNTYDNFRELMNRWRQIGSVPQQETSNLWNSYNFLVEKFFDRVRINEELKDLDLRKNLEKKIELCEKVEDLFLEPSINKSFKLLQQYREEWKETGPVPHDKKDEIWERFNAACEKLAERRKEYYEKLHEEQSRNLQLKTALCEKMEQINELVLTTPKEFEEKRKEVEAIQSEWKTIGYAPKKENDEIWARFKAALDQFYNTRKEFYKELKNERLENLNKKIALCLQAEALKDSTDWKRTTDELLKLQEEWKKIGPVPQLQSEKIWKRFRESFDYFFNRKAEYFANIDEIQNKNLQLKLELIEKVENYVFGDDNEQNLSLLKDFQRQWTEIGHVPAKEKDQLYQRFRAAINKHMEALKISTSVVSNLRYQEKLKSMKEAPDSKQKIQNEKKFLTNKINTIKSDIAIWENNIGFLSNSKNSEILRQDYLKRIDQAKQTLKELEEKLRMLNSLTPETKNN